MLKRVLTAIVAIGVLIPVLVFSDTWFFPFACCVLASVAIFEIMGCIDVRKKLSLSIPTFVYELLIFAVSAVYFLSAKSDSPVLPASALAAVIFALTFFYVFWILAAMMLSLGEVKFTKGAELIIWTLYILMGFVSLIMLRRQIAMGAYLYGLVFIGAWATDTGAYFIGVLFGKHKLIPEVSPKKTVEGAFGGVLGAILGFTVYAFILQNISDLKVNYIALIVLAIVIAVVSQFGDLIASYVKRECGIKDFGFIFPGHGGVLDRFDSIIAVAPAIYFILLLLQEYAWIFQFAA